MVIFKFVNLQDKIKRGIYETAYGNAAYVSGPTAKKAFDLDLGEWVPIEEVTHNLLRKAQKEDVNQSKRG